MKIIRSRVDNNQIIMYFQNDDGKIKRAQNILEELLNSPNISQRSNERISNILKTFEKK